MNKNKEKKRELTHFLGHYRKTEEMERSRPIEPTVAASSVSTSVAQTDRPLESNGQSISATQPSMDGLPPSLAEKVFVVRPKI